MRVKAIKHASTNWGHLPDVIGIWRCWLLRRGENLLEQGEKQQKTLPTYDTGTGNRTRASLVGDEFPHAQLPTPPPLLHQFKSHCRNSCQTERLHLCFST